MDLLLTVGRQIDPLALGPVPGNVRIERYVPQWSVLPHADVVVTHGGSGGLLGALAHGTPVLVLPLGGDQPHNAARVEALGVGWVLDAITTDAGQIGDAVATLLTDGEVRAAAAAVGAECDELPEPASAVPMVEAVAAGRRTG